MEQPTPQERPERPPLTPEVVLQLRVELIKAERMLIPLLNQIRVLLGKKPLKYDS